jgi:ABC-2 type transport system ATP-binding protein
MIEIKDLSFAYTKKNPIFEQVSFSIKSGIHGLLGENGVGKTTLLHIISGLRFAQKGTCRINGIDSFKRSPAVMSQLYYLPDEIEVPKQSARIYARYHSPFYPDYNNDQFEKYLEDFHVDGDKSMKYLSYGQCKKAIIAFALATNTKILLMDEPTNGLDIPSKWQFRKIIASLTDDTRCIILSTHQVRDVENLMDTIIILDENAVLLNNTIDEITQQLHFSYSSEKPVDALFYEEHLQGYVAVSENKLSIDSKLNIEALFSAVINNKSRIKELFNIQNIKV